MSVNRGGGTENTNTAVNAPQSNVNAEVTEKPGSTAPGVISSSYPPTIAIGERGLDNSDNKGAHTQ